MIEKKIDKKSIFLTATGACLEWYEFSIFMYVTPMISRAFFPEQNHVVALLASFGLLAAGYFMRPIGGIVFGNLGDKWGRKIILTITTGLMSIPMLGTALLPTYHQWGITAVILLLLLRMLQGLSVGGEYTSVLTMLLEQAPKKHRALTTSLASIVSGLGIVLSAIVVTLLTHYLGEQRMYEWGWRLPFLLGFIMSVAAYFAQRQLHESPYFKQAITKKTIAKTPILHALKEHPRDIFYVFLMAGFLGIPCYLGIAFFSNYLITVLHMNKESVMQITILCDLIYLPFIPIAAAISDKVGRKPVLLVTTTLFIVVAFPAFSLINSKHLSQALWGNAIILIIYGCEVAIFVTMINELFPTEQRLSGMSTGYNVGNAVFGGTTPLVVTYFISHTDNHFAPAWYLAIASFITLLFIFTMPETLNKSLSN